MSDNGPPRNDYKVRNKYQETPSIACAKRKK